MELTFFLKINGDLLNRRFTSKNLSSSSFRITTPVAQRWRFPPALRGGGGGKRLSRLVDHRRRTAGEIAAMNTVTTSTMVHSHHLLLCLGVLSPNPLGLILPLAPNGTLADYVKRVAEDAGLGNGGSVVAHDGGESHKSLLLSEHPIHPITMMMIVHQVETGVLVLSV